MVKIFNNSAGNMRFVVLAIAALSFVLGPLQIDATYAQQVLEIREVRVEAANVPVTIVVTTNVPASVIVEYGETTEYSASRSSTTSNQTTHIVTLLNVKSEARYHYKVTASSNGRAVSTFDRSFTTGSFPDTHIPRISNVHAAYVTATTATIQWVTDEPTSTAIRYGKSTQYGSTRSSSARVTDHDITITRLTPNTRYHYQVSSKDKAGNAAVFYNLEFTTAWSAADETTPLTVSAIRPLTTADPNITSDTVTVSWRTNKPANGVIRYGTSTRLRESVTVPGMRSYDHQAILLKLKPNTTYYFRVESKDVFGKVITSDTFSFITRIGSTTGTGDPTERPAVLGYSTADLTRAEAMLRPAGSSDVYAILNGQKYRLPYGADDLALYGKSARDIRRVSQKELDAIPFVRLVRSPLTGRIYYMYRRPEDYMMKLYIPSPAIFASYSKNRWQDVVTIPHTDIEAIPDVRVVRASGASVYDIQTAERRLIVSHVVFLRRGYKESDIAGINDLHLASFRVGAYIQ